jgi:hypothetical protein
MALQAGARDALHSTNPHFDPLLLLQCLTSGPAVSWFTHTLGVDVIF